VSSSAERVPCGDTLCFFWLLTENDVTALDDDASLCPLPPWLAAVFNHVLARGVVRNRPKREGGNTC